MAEDTSRTHLRVSPDTHQKARQLLSLLQAQAPDRTIWLKEAVDIAISNELEARLEATK
jgi:hypothetical protein